MDDLDTTFYANEESEDEQEIFENSADEQPKGSIFIVYWSYLLILLQDCLTCAHRKKLITKGCAICVHLLYQNGHFKVYQSQPMQNHHYIGNLRLRAPVHITNFPNTSR